jgi:3-hydroxyisobutyrate dehydrogenase-like beta-hydroxyacid dehydrogenase
MKPIIGLVAPGAMGAGIGRRLTERGATVLTSLAGRSAGSAARAAAAGMTAVSDPELAAADFLLSVLPPSDALALARRFAPHLAAGDRKPVFVDCNAVTPETVRGIAEVIGETGADFVDGSIIGGPPKAGYGGPTLYVCGPAAARVAALRDFGLEIAVLDRPVGAASALKMSYAGITKGLVALGAVMVLGAARKGVDDELYRELAASQPALLAWLTQSVPGMYAKAYRWVGEMEEIADFVGADPAGRQIYAAAAQLYARLAADDKGDRTEIARLDAFMKSAGAAPA